MGSVRVNLKCGTCRFGLRVKVGGTVGGPDSGVDEVAVFLRVLPCVVRWVDADNCTEVDSGIRSHLPMLIDSRLVGSTTGRGAARAEVAQGKPTQSHVSPSMLVYEDE